MIEPRDAANRRLADDSPEAYAAARSGQRLSRLGRILRGTRVDELPSVPSMLAGSMSLVGPRRLLVEYLDRYTPELMRRHEVKPGITGWAHVHARQAKTREERFALDGWYFDHISLWQDPRILLLTGRAVLTRRGRHEPRYATGTEFMGTRDGR